VQADRPPSGCLAWFINQFMRVDGTVRSYLGKQRYVPWKTTHRQTLRTHFSTSCFPPLMYASLTETCKIAPRKGPCFFTPKSPFSPNCTAEASAWKVISPVPADTGFLFWSICVVVERFAQNWQRLKIFKNLPTGTMDVEPSEISESGFLNSEKSKLTARAQSGVADAIYRRCWSRN